MLSVSRVFPGAEQQCSNVMPLPHPETDGCVCSYIHKEISLFQSNCSDKDFSFTSTPLFGEVFMYFSVQLSDQSLPSVTLRKSYFNSISLVEICTLHLIR